MLYSTSLLNIYFFATWQQFEKIQNFLFFFNDFSLFIKAVIFICKKSCTAFDNAFNKLQSKFWASRIKIARVMLVTSLKNMVLRKKTRYDYHFLFLMEKRIPKEYFDFSGSREVLPFKEFRYTNQNASKLIKFGDIEVIKFYKILSTSSSNLISIICRVLRCPRWWERRFWRK